MTLRTRTYGMMIAALALTLGAQKILAQTMSEKDVRTRLDAVYAGKASEVRAELPGLLAKYPNDAGVRYLQAVMTTDGASAVKRYEEIVQKFPQSPWADDALYKVYQYDYSTGLYKKADSVMAQLRAAYPSSIYAAAPSETKSEEAVQRTAVAGTKADEAVKRPAAVQQNAEAASAPAAPAAAAKHTSVTGGKAPARGGYDVQAGLFSTEANARSAAGRLGVVSGREPRVKPKTSGERTVYLVVFEGFETAESARRFSAELRTKHNIDSFVNPR